MPSNHGQGGESSHPAAAGREDEEILAAVRALQSGAGPDAFAPIARRFTRPLNNFFSNRPELRDQAEDLTQATLLKVYEKVGTYRFEAAFSTWLRQIAENIWKNAVRDLQTAKRGAPVQSLDSVVDEDREEPASLRIPDEAPTPEQAALAQEGVRFLREAIEALPQGMRQCAELRLFADLKYREIAEATGIGLNSVRSQLFEARKRLKPVLDEYFHGAEL
ncbi:MAG TPA: sigma-70 family RNA polymerase sigma factor [Thermoanaerobaculia bacterium]|nr:sigma-70 family RNA polymerase sigma factor [Thermoanaerobaculia bacterium]